ncbi:MAG: hypothetical protein KME31_00055 [Tolypothrix carrinoi HA7290-LM1]|jgi:hypothetical protein|nr:hypothetical protein [Tolypothrix carrinoi HA7290-LM1]
MLPEYHLDYHSAKPNRFAGKSGKRKMTVVVLDEDVAQVFTTPESVNKVLRALIETMPQTTQVMRSPPQGLLFETHSRSPIALQMFLSHYKLLMF